MSSKENDKNAMKVEQAYTKLKKAYLALKDSHVEMVFKLALVSEMRDRSTGVHLVRIADYSALIAEGLGLDKNEIEIVRMASPMHDIGKVMLPDAILKKDGGLTGKEMDEMKKHPLVGARIFAHAKTPMLKACEVIARTHHERYDGTGYPKGLKGEDIPLYGRIVALADCFDAYTSRRPYKEAFSFDESVSMVKERAGTHFSPAAVAAFLRQIEKIKKIWKANRDIQAFLDEMELEQEKLLE
jgi:putative two-component system response regulator